MSNTRPDFRLIKQRVGILDVLTKYAIETRRLNATTYRAHCPLPQHEKERKEATLAINSEKNVWSCHSASCVANRGAGKKGGDILEFVKFMERVSSIREAGQRLEEWFGPFDDSLAIVHEKAPQVAAEQVDETPAENKPLGFELKGLDHGHDYLKSRGFDEEECEYLGVGFFGGKGSMSGRIVFPIHDQKAQLIAYAGRCVEGTEPRWKLPAGFHKTQVIYNWHRVWHESEIFVVESFWGVLACVRAGIMNAVAIMGSTASDAQVTELASFGRVVICFDNDRPGREGAINLAERLSNAGAPRVEIVMLPAGFQPDHLDPDKLRDLLGIPPEPDAALTAVEEALPTPEAVPA